MTSRQLHGWKDIAGYLGRGVRAAQRWEKDLGLPVHRLPTQSGHAVYAIPEELDAWRAEAERRNVNALAALGRDEELSGGLAETEFAAVATSPHDPDPPGARSEITPGLISGPPRRGDINPGLVFSGGEPIVVPPPARASRFATRRLVLAAAMLAILALAVGWVAVGRDAPRGVPAAGAAALAQGFSDVDAGPWPVNGANPYRTAQSALRGPSRRPEARVVFDAGPALIAPSSPLAASSLGTIVVGTTDGRVVAFDLGARVRWTQTLDREANAEAATGVALTRALALISTQGFPTSPLSNPRTQFTALDLVTGAVRFRHRTGGQGFHASIGRDGGIYQADQYNTLRKYDALGTVVWTVDFPGFRLLPPLETPDARVLVLTDGGVFGQSSFHALDRDGRVISRAGTGSYVAAAMLADGGVVALDLAVSVGNTRETSPSVRRLSPLGEQIWEAQVPEGFPDRLAPEPAIGANGIVVRSTTHLVALRFDGKERWRVALPPGVGSPGPILDVDGNIYVAAGGKVLSFTDAGVPRWEIEVADEVPDALAAGITGTLRLIIPSDGTLLLATGRRVVALQ